MISPLDILKAKILIVDDQEANVLLLDRILRGTGYLSVASTRNPREVCALHRQNNYDLILLDLEMPGLDGFQVMEALKEIETDGYIPVLVITAQAEHKLRALRSGAKDFVSKPVDLAEVLTRVHNMLEVRLLHHQARALYDVVAAERAALLYAKEEISRHARDLEQTISVRTAQLHQTVEELEAFSYSVSHDMRAPLRAMQGYAQCLVTEYSGRLDEQGVNFLQQIMRSSVRLDRLIRDLLTYTTLLNRPLPMESVNLDRLVRDIIETHPSERIVKPEIKITGALPVVLGNVALLTQCFSNLLGNGAKFVTPGTIPRIEIAAQEITPDPGDLLNVRIWFQDNGLGIASENHHRIFRIFEQVHPAAEFEGTGIGLSIVRKAAERMGARVGFASTLGQGSRFWIDLVKG